MVALATTSRSSFRVIGSVLGVAVLLTLGSLGTEAAQRPSCDDAFRVCQQELQDPMSREIGGRQPDVYVDERQVQISQASNSEARVRGNGRYMRDSNDRGRDFSFHYQNARDNRARADYRWGSSENGGGQYLDPGYGRPPIGGSTPDGSVFFSGDIVSRLSGKCLDVEGASSRDAANVQQWTCSGGSNQKWNVIQLGRGQFSIISRGSNKALTVSGGGGDGANVEQFRWSGGENQRWRLDKGRNDTFQIVSVSHNSCLDVEGAKRENGANIQLWGCSGGANQAWVLRK